MKIRALIAVAAIGVCSAASVWAKDYTVGEIEVDHPWIRASVPGQVNGAGYMKIENGAKKPDRLLAVRSDVAERIELHTIVNEDGVAKMRLAEGGVTIPAEGKVRLAPGGYHIMFLKLKAPFVEGAEVPATLKFEQAGEIAVKFKVKPAAHNQNSNDSATHDHSGMKH
jgi:periplasmic copper chaperone A